MDRLMQKIKPRLLAWLDRSRSGPISFLRLFSYEDIRRATDDFQSVVYSNAYGAAYRARLRSGVVVLVKEVQGFAQGKNSFNREVQLLGRLYHRNLLALRGFSTGHRSFLVFDNIESGTLKEHLNDPLRTPLNWRTRLRIAIGVAAALEYLLLFSCTPTCHVSISSSNIMLDENFTAKLSDIGILPGDANHVKLPHAPSPEDRRSQKCGDIIFQLGVLILELITGQSSEKGGTDLVQWIQESRSGSSIQKMIDPDLGNNYNSKELKNLLAVARLCIKSGDRPKFSIPQVFRYLQKKVEIAVN